MNFAEAAKQKSNFTRTENGAVALNTSGNKCLDFYASIGSLREADENRIIRLFADAYLENPLLATKIVFYGRDIRGGLGERETFRKLIRYMAEYHPGALRPNLKLIGYYGRWDDLYSLIGTSLEDEMWETMWIQFKKDVDNMNEGKEVSLLAKWIKTADASSKNTRKLGILTAQKFGQPVYVFKRLVRDLRKYIKVTECYMSANEWDKIEYSQVPSRAMMVHKNAFMKHDEARFNNFILKAVEGKEKINSSTLYPYDLIEKILKYGIFSYKWSIGEDKTIEAQWRQLPNYVDENTNAIVIADTSGSMYGRPISSALGLAIYFAERNKGAYHNLWMSFSSEPKFHTLKGETLVQKLSSIDMNDWNRNTDLKAAFELILDVAIKNNVPQNEMPKALIVISDMEIDECGNEEWTFYDKMAHKYEKLGYVLPSIIFWNVNSRHDVFHADSSRKGVQLVGGQSVSTFKNLMKCVEMTPVEAMLKTLNSERYETIKIDLD